MAKSKGNSAGWIVTFADLMALLLTFFVLLLSFSTMDAKKYDAIVQGFDRAFSIEWRSIFGKPDAIGSGHDAKISIPMPTPSPTLPIDSSEQVTEEMDDTALVPAKEMYGELADILEAQIASGGVELESRKGQVIIRFTEDVSFPSGSADLEATFIEALDRIRPVLERSSGEIIVSGHTDDRPISTSQFRSNWDLSAARAASAVHYILSNTQITADRIIAQGRADTVPLLPNENEQYRAKNRRVEISINKASR